MTTQKILSVLGMYENRLLEENIQKKRMDEEWTFGSLSKQQALEHAHFLIKDTRKLAFDLNRRRKTGSHLTAIQICLSIAEWYTLGELMEHLCP